MEAGIGAVAGKKKTGADHKRTGSVTLPMGYGLNLVFSPTDHLGGGSGGCIQLHPLFL